MSREWISRGLVIGALVAIVALPFVLRKDEAPALKADDTVIIITPHNEAIRSEFSRGFEGWYRRKTGRSVAVDWRVIGGTSEIARFLSGEYTSSFRLHWQRDLGQPWTAEVAKSFNNSGVVLDESPADDTAGERARRAFLASDATSGIDVFFGGGVYDFSRQASAGQIVDSGILEQHSEWFSDHVIPHRHNGEVYWAGNGQWVGAVLASFGILYNSDSLVRLGIEKSPTNWRDLTDPRYFGELALADPTKSSSIAKAFEMVIQREMQDRLNELLAEGVPEEDVEQQAVEDGWVRGFEILQLMGANARYFTDSSQKPPIDVAQGDSAAGMCIDFYGRYQAEAVTRRDAEPRLFYVTPTGGSVYSPDPIAMMRGAPNPELARRFIEYVMSPSGQALWNTKVGAEGGPAVFALRRLPMRKELYAPDLASVRSDPEVNPYSAENDFEYRAEWTGGLFREMAFLIRVVCLDAHKELASAWRAIIEAGMPKDALEKLSDLRAVTYDAASGEVKAALRSGDPVDTVRLGKELANHFRRQYTEAEAIARRSDRAR